MQLRMGDTIIWVRVGRIERGRVQLLFEAPREVIVVREELLAQIHELPADA